MKKENIISSLWGAPKNLLFWACFLAFLFLAGCTVQMEVTDNRKQDDQPDGGLVYPEDIPESFSWRRFYWEQIEKSDSTYSFAITDGDNDGRWTDSVRWLPALPGIKVVGDTLATRAYARTQGGGGGDNLGDHIATQNIQLGSNYLSGDGDNEGFSVNAAGDITHSAKTTLSDTVYTTGARPVEIKKVNTLTWSANELTAFSLEQNESGKISSWNTSGGLFLKGVTSIGANPGIGLYAYTGAQPTTWGNFMVNTSVHDGAGALIPVADGSPMVKFRNLFGDRLSLFGNGDLVLQDGTDTSALISVNELAFPQLSYLDGDSVLVANGNNRIGKRAVSELDTKFVLNGDSGTPQTVDNADTLDIVGGYGINTVSIAIAGITNTVNVEIDSSEVATQYDLTQIAGLDTLTNYTALRAYTGGSNAVYIQDQGFFVRSATGSENGGTIIVASNSVVWRRFFDGCTYYPEFWEDGGYDETGSAAGITDTTEMIQAAINLANTNGGGEVILKPGKYYSVIPKGTNVGLGGTNKYCVKILDNIKFTIPRGSELRKADGAQTDAGGAVSILYGECASNVEISGGGVINGNTAGQTGWTGGYSQAGVNGAGVYFARTAGAATLCNYDIIIRDLIIKDNFANPIVISRFNGLTLSGIECHDNGEGIELTTGEDASIENIEIADTADVAVGDGLELSAVDYFRINDIYIHSNGAGTAVDLYASKNGTLSGFVLDGFGGGGISTGTNANDRICTNIEITNGLIKNYPTNGSTGIYVRDGKYKISNIIFDSTNIGIGIDTIYAPASVALINETTISNCDFINEPNGSGIFISGQKRVTVQNCTFRKLSTGIQNSYSANGDPVLRIKNNVFDSLASANIVFDAQGQTYPTYNPVAYIEDNTFTNQLGTIGIAGIETPLNVYVKNNSSDFYPTATTTMNMQGLEELDGSTGGSTIQTINRGAHEQILRIDCGEMPALNARTVRDPRETAGGNIYLKDGENFKMTTGAVVTLKYDKVNNRWHEVSRATTMPFTGSGSPVGNTKMIIEGWMVDDIQDSLSYTQVKRFNTSASLGYYFIARRQFAVRKVCIYSSVAITTGSVTAGLFWNGGGPNATVTLDNTNQQNNTTTYDATSKLVGADALVEMRYSTSNDFGHPTADIYMWIEIEY